MHRRFGRNDLLFIGGLTVIGVALLIIFSIINQKSGTAVVITKDGVVYGTYPLSENQTIEIEDANHNVTNILKIEDGKAKMIEAHCPDQLCVHQKAVSIEKENIVCLPNRIVVTVTGEHHEGLDGFAQ